MHNYIVFLSQAVPEGRVFAVDTQTFITAGIQLLNGIILTIALGFILYKPVKEFMSKRTASIQSKIEDSDAAMTNANEVIDEYKTKLKDIDKEHKEVLEAARIKATEEGKVIIEEAKREADEIKKRSMESISVEKKRLKEEARIYIIDLSSRIAEKYIAQNISDETQNKLLEDALTQLEGAEWQN